MDSCVDVTAYGLKAGPHDRGRESSPEPESQASGGGAAISSTTIFLERLCWYYYIHREIVPVLLVFTYLQAFCVYGGFLV